MRNIKTCEKCCNEHKECFDTCMLITFGRHETDIMHLISESKSFKVLEFVDLPVLCRYMREQTNEETN